MPSTTALTPSSVRSSEVSRSGTSPRVSPRYASSPSQSANSAARSLPVSATDTSIRSRDWLLEMSSRIASKPASKIPRSVAAASSSSISPMCSIQRNGTCFQGYRDGHELKKDAKGADHATARNQEGHQARASVRAHQEEPERAGTLRGQGRGDCRTHCPEGARPPRGVAHTLPHVDPGHVLRAPGRPALGDFRPKGSHPRPALQRGQEPQHRGPLGYEQAAAAARGRRQEALTGTARPDYEPRLERLLRSRAALASRNSCARRRAC